MNNLNHPVRGTVFYGLICGLVFIPLGIFFEQTVFWPFFFRSAIFTCLAVYSFMLAAMTNSKRLSVIFPLMFLFIFIFTSSSIHAFLLLSLGLLSWIRSGVCFQHSVARSLGAELIFSIGGGALVTGFSPYSTVSWALGIWMFFLVQSVYFIVMTDLKKDEAPANEDTFEQSRMRAEGILNSVHP